MRDMLLRRGRAVAGLRVTYCVTSTIRAFRVGAYSRMPQVGDRSLPATGEVDNVRATSAPRPEFGEAAVAAIRKAKFRPAQHDGQPVLVHLHMPVRFEEKE